MKNLPFLIALIAFFMVELVSCNDSGIPPAGADTTSHNITWAPPFLLGNGGASELNDVCIVNDNLAYAAGAVYLRDSLGNFDPLPYNLAKWDGSTWQLQPVTVSYQGGPVTTPVYGIFAFSSSDIWLSAGVPIHGDGSQWRLFHLFDMGVLNQNDGSLRRIWGSDPSSIYFVGNRGTVVHYANGTWEKLESGTSLRILDIWGADDALTGRPTVLAIASGSSPSEGKKLLHVQGTTITAIADSGLSWELSGIWFVPNVKYYVVGAGIHYKSLLQEPVWNFYPSGVVTSYYSSGVRGNSPNDVFVVGSFFEVVHFNGLTWHNYRNEIPYSPGVLGRVPVKENLVIAVGLMGQQALVLVGRR